MTLFCLLTDQYVFSNLVSYQFQYLANLHGVQILLTHCHIEHLQNVGVLYENFIISFCLY